MTQDTDVRTYYVAMDGVASVRQMPDVHRGDTQGEAGKGKRQKQS